MWLSTGEASSLGAEEVAGRLDTNLHNGLDWREVELRRQLAGFNELTVLEEEPTWKKYIEQVGFKPLQNLSLPTFSGGFRVLSFLT